MGGSYPDLRKNIPTSQIILFCSYGVTLIVPLIPGNVFGSDERNDVSSPVERESCAWLCCVHIGQKCSRSPIARSCPSTSEISVPGKTFRLIWSKCNISYYFYNKAKSRLLTCRNVFSLTGVTFAHTNQPSVTPALDENRATIKQQGYYFGGFIQVQLINPLLKIHPLLHSISIYKMWNELANCRNSTI
jgi:hypothetical protein